MGSIGAKRAVWRMRLNCFRIEFAGATQLLSRADKHRTIKPAGGGTKSRITYHLSRIYRFCSPLLLKDFPLSPHRFCVINDKLRLLSIHLLKFDKTIVLEESLRLSMFVAPFSISFFN